MSHVPWPTANRYARIDLVPPHKKIFQTYKNWRLKTLFGRRSQARTSPDGRVDGPEPLFPPKKGRFFGKSRASDVVRCTPGNTLLTKALNYSFELKFCRQCIYQRQFRICDPCRVNKFLLLQLCEAFSAKVLGGALAGKLNLRSGSTLNPLDIKH